MKKHELVLEQNKGCQYCSKNCNHRGLTTTKENNANVKRTYGCNSINHYTFK